MCPLPVENCSSDLINLLKDRFDIADSVDEAGHFTDDPGEIKVFSFNFVNKKGENKGTVVVSLLDDSESANSLKIYFGQDLGDSDTETRTEWYAFLQDIRQFAKMHLLGFDVRNINKSQINRRDVEKDLKLVTEDILPMFEGTFLPIDGTAKTSHQKLDGEPIKIVIKHTTKVDPEVRGSRSRRIARIYLVNAKNERFLLPFKNLVAARAMARHIENGGTPYDNVGRDICQLVEEMVSLNKFYHKQKKSESASKPYVSSILAATRERYLEIKKTLASLSSKGGYAKNSPALTGTAGELEADDEVFEDAFDGESLDEESQLALPHVMRAYRSHGKVKEQDEFEKWVNAANGQGEGQDVIMDGGVDNEEELTPEEQKAIELGQEDYNWKRAEDSDRNAVTGEVNEDIEDTPEKFTGEQCISCGGEGCDICGYSGNSARREQEDAGKIAGEEDLTLIHQAKEDAEDYRPFEYGGMNGSIPTSDEIRGTGQMNLESEMSRLKKIVENNELDNDPEFQKYLAKYERDAKAKDFAARGYDKPEGKSPEELKQYLTDLWQKYVVEPDSKGYDTSEFGNGSFEDYVKTLATDDFYKGHLMAKAYLGESLNEDFQDMDDFEDNEEQDTTDEYQWEPMFDTDGKLSKAHTNFMKNRPVKESQLTELFGFKGKEAKANQDKLIMEKLLKDLDFERIVNNPDNQIWKKSYFSVIFGPAENKKLGWIITRNGQFKDKGFGSRSFFEAFFMGNPEFREELRRISAKNNEKELPESKGIIDDLLQESGLLEADVPSSTGWSGPLTWTNVHLGTKFRKPAEIEKHENTTGKLSPFSLLSTPERDVDDAGKEVPKLQPRGVRSIAMPNDASGIDSMSQW